MGFQKSFKALGDPVRREILSLLRREPMAAGDIATHFDQSGACPSCGMRVWCWMTSRASTFTTS